MKLRLPKLLCAAVVAALAMPAMGADGPIKWDPSTGMPSTGIPYPNNKQYNTNLNDTDVHKVQYDNNGNSYLDVFYYKGYSTASYNWYGDLVVGSTAESKGYVDNVGSFVDNWEWVTPTESVVTPELQVHGNLTVQGNGKVVLGGMFSDYPPNYKGIKATGITVNGGSLTATRITATDLVVNGGTVSTSTPGCNKGSYRSGSSQSHSYIQNSLTISGGSLSFGYTGDDIKGIDSNMSLMTVFGDSSFSMTQTGGTMNVYGAMNLKAGATITQTGGATVLRDTVFLQGAGSTKFDQSADSTLVIGRLESTSSENVQSIEFKQSGEGLIHLAYGGNFKKESTISLNQTGNGTINIGGGHDTDLTGELPTGYALDKVDTNASTTSFESVNTTYQINQSGSGEINIMENATIVADSVNVGENAHLVVDGQLDIATGEGKSAKVYGTVSGTGTITVTSGVLENHGTISTASSQATFAEGDISTLADSEVLLITIAGGEFVNYGTTDSSILVDGGTLTLDEGVLADVTLNSGTIVVNSDSTTGTLTLNGGTIIFEENAKLTLVEGAELNLTNTVIEVLVSEETLAGLKDGSSDQVTLFETNDVTTDLKGITVNFTDGTNDLTAKVDGTADGTGVVITTTVPEPTTATLSLLALAALAARRRRK